MGCRVRQLTWPSHIESLSYQEKVTYGSKTDSKSLQPSSSEYEPPFGLSPRVKRCLIALGIIDGHIEGLDEYLAIQSESPRDFVSQKTSSFERR